MKFEVTSNERQGKRFLVEWRNASQLVSTTNGKNLCIVSLKRLSFPPPTWRIISRALT